MYIFSLVLEKNLVLITNFLFGLIQLIGSMRPKFDVWHNRRSYFRSTQIRVWFVSWNGSTLGLGLTRLFKSQIKQLYIYACIFI